MFRSSFLRTVIISAAVSFLSTLSCCNGSTPRFEVTEVVLDNGLTVLLHEDHSAPIVSYRSFYRVGSRNEEAGIRGGSQLIEHMMYNGTQRFAAGEFDSLLENSGGSSSAYTTKDMTVYSCEFHRSLLPTVIELEADRMKNLMFTPADIEKEKKIIAEERLRTVDNSVRGRMREKLFMLAFREHPYRYPAIGGSDDISSITADRCRAYYRKRYLPGNAVIAAAGDFKTERVLELIRRYYGPIEGGEIPEDRIAAEPPQNEERRDTLDVRFRVPVVKMGFRTPPAGSEDIYPLDILQIILDGGSGSILPQQLVGGMNIASDAGTFFPWRADPALFIVTIRMREGIDPAEGIGAFYSVIGELAENGIDEMELEKAKKMIRAGYFRGMESVTGRSSRIGRYHLLLGDHRKIYEVQNRYRKVSGEDVVRAAEHYFRRQNSSVVLLLESGD